MKIRQKITFRFDDILAEKIQHFFDNFKRYFDCIG